MSKANQGITGLISALLLSAGMLSTAAMAADDAIAQGKKIAFDRKKGNCLGCHVIEGGDLPGNIGPPLIAMKSRFPDKAKLRAQIYDATARNPHTPMPPFGKHGALSDKEIDLITEYVYSL
ncbi:MAG: sulfur oxidation c-type cytochrome SoxX [Chromatiales bacterium]|jgi:sulfur-oxidizing protein SoxX